MKLEGISHELEATKSSVETSGRFHEIKTKANQLHSASTVPKDDPFFYIFVLIPSRQSRASIQFHKDLTMEELLTALYSACDLPCDSQRQLTLLNMDGTKVDICPGISGNTEANPYILLDSEIYKDGTSVSDIIEQEINKLGQLKMTHEELYLLRENINNLKKRLDKVDIDKLSFGKPFGVVHKLSNLTKPIEGASPRYTFSEDVKASLKKPTFNNWKWDDNELISLLELIFSELGLIQSFDIRSNALRNFLYNVRDNYNNNPFHNFKHCFCVTQMMYSILNVSGLINTLTMTEKLILAIACIGHDLDHPGYNNAYQINAKTDLAITYNDNAPLEMHHAAVLFGILKKRECNILEALSDSVYREVRKGVIRCILSTDMAKHGEILAQFKKVADNFNYNDADQRSLLLSMIIKCSDISNEVRPPEVAEPWVNCLLEEFFAQSDREKAEGLPTAPFMDREKVTKASAQIGFIGYVMIPLFDLVAKVLPNIETEIVSPIRDSLAYYKQLLEKPDVGNTSK